jgi:hypothetical protein
MERWKREYFSIRISIKKSDFLGSLLDTMSYLESSEHILFQLFFLSGDGLILGFERTKNLIFQRQRLRVELPSSFSSEYVCL